MGNKMALDALTAIAEMDPQGIRGDDLGRAARTARAAIAALQAEPVPANEREAALWRMVTANPQRSANLLSSWCDDGSATIEELEAAISATPPKD